MPAPRNDTFDASKCDRRATIVHRGARLAYRVRGGGPGVLLIQGAGVHGDGWRPQTDALSASYTCLSFDNRGMGMSQAVDSAGGCVAFPKKPPLSIPQMADDAIMLMDAEGWTAAHIVGHSIGGLIALHLAIFARVRVRSLALLCTFANGREAAPFSARMLWLGMRSRIGTRQQRRAAFLQLVWSRRALACADREALAARLTPLFGHDPGDQPPIVAQQLAAMRAYDASSRLAELAPLPTLVVSAQTDPIAPPALGRRLAEGIPGARFVEIAEASHGLPIEMPDCVNDLLFEHFSGAAGSGAAT